MQQRSEKQNSSNSFHMTRIGQIFQSISVISQEYVHCLLFLYACSSEKSILLIYFLFVKVYSFIRPAYLSVLASYNLSIQ